MSTTFSGFFQPFQIRSPSILVGTSVAVTLAAIATAKIIFQSPPRKITASPRVQVLSKLSKAEQEELPYPPDVFPGARDVQSPYGSMRVYEWGPEDGKKVLLVHGITTPCVALGAVANALVARGCRVILFDLFGRGYSDSPDLPHDTRLYTTQILLGLASSPLSWTPDGFNLVGYSLGGGISAEFAARFPNLVKELVLLAPAGLIRSHHFGWSSRLAYSPLVPDYLINWVVGRRLRGASSQKSTSSPKDAEDTNKVVNAEIKGNRDPAFESAVLSKSRPGVTVASAVQWQVENHEGFLGSFISSIRFAPIEKQWDTWKLLGAQGRKVLIVAGKTDAVILCDELKEDVLSLVEVDKIEWKEIDGGHEFPITKGEEVAGVISEVWNL